MAITAGEAVGAETLRQRPVAYNGFLSLGPKLRFNPSPAMRPLVGRANVGVELGGGYRLVGPLRGLTFSGGLGWTPHQARFVDGDSVSFEPRQVVWGHLGVGYRLLVPRGSLGASYRFRVTGITALDEPACAGHPTCDQWIWPTQALALDQTVSLGRRWSLYVEEEAGLSFLDVDGTGSRASVDLGIRVGVEVGL